MIEHLWDIYTESEERVNKEEHDELARYRAMFPVAPWDDGPITPEVCERLGMERSDCGYRTADRFINVWHIGTRWRVIFCGLEDDSIKTAGQLACLVAARRAR